MKCKYLFFITMLFVNISLHAQKTDFTRGKGFLIRPDIHNDGLFVNGGYQFSPFWQVSLGAGAALVGPVYSALADIRLYTNEDKWSGMFNYSILVGYYYGNYYGTNYEYLVVNHAFVCGVSYKDLDFGNGILVRFVDGDFSLGLAFTLGWNIRLYKHR